MPRKKDLFPVQFSLRMTEEMKRAVEDAASKDDLPGVMWIRRAIQRELEREGAMDGTSPAQIDIVIEERLFTLLDNPEIKSRLKRALADD